MTQYGFFFDQSRCDHCSSCAVACKQWYNLPPGQAKWLRLLEYETGAFPTSRLHTLFAICYHCENPVCVDAADGAMYKEEKYGAVLIDPDKAASSSMRKAWVACPYGAIQFESDAPDAKASMCTMCIDRLEEGKAPVCVTTCHMRALDFGPLEELKKKYGSNSQLAGMPDPTEVKPAVVFRPSDPRKEIVPYNPQRALELLAKRPYGLPKVYDSPQDATEIPQGLIARPSLNMKPKTSEEIFRYTTHNEG
jgi:anaerobic dimethyl sulfoxide reductase subunit B (iron-sulfur subunit)